MRTHPELHCIFIYISSFDTRDSQFPCNLLPPLVPQENAAHQDDLSTQNKVIESFVTWYQVQMSFYLSKSTIIYVFLIAWAQIHRSVCFRRYFCFSPLCFYFPVSVLHLCHSHLRYQKAFLIFFRYINTKYFKFSTSFIIPDVSLFLCI